MFVQIVVLYMAYQYNLPTWCKVFVLISLVINLVRLGYGCNKSYKA